MRLLHRQDKALLAAERGIVTIKKTKWSIIVLSIVSMARVRQALLVGRRRCWQTPAQQRYALTRCAAGVHHAILQLHAISTRARSSDLTRPQTSHAGATQSGHAGICKAPACGARDGPIAINTGLSQGPRTPSRFRPCGHPGLNQVWAQSQLCAAAQGGDAGRHRTARRTPVR